jgi:hypothetical protein
MRVKLAGGLEFPGGGRAVVKFSEIANRLTDISTPLVGDRLPDF